MSGSKVRKLAGLLPHLDGRKVIAWGGANSNFLASLAQVLNEQEIDYLFYVRKSYFEGPSAQVINLMAGEERLITVERADWPPHINDKDAFIIPEGGVCDPCFEGAKTLADDIARNELELGISFENIYLDAGTGLTARAAIARAKELKKPWHFHVLLLAEDDIGLKEDSHLTLYRPPKKTFGPISKSDREKALTISKAEGFLLDPIYSAPLFLFFKDEVKPRSLVVHSGCGLNTL